MCIVWILGDAHADALMSRSVPQRPESARSVRRPLPFSAPQVRRPPRARCGASGVVLSGWLAECTAVTQAHATVSSGPARLGIAVEFLIIAVPLHAE